MLSWMIVSVLSAKDLEEKVLGISKRDQPTFLRAAHTIAVKADLVAFPFIAIEIMLFCAVVTSHFTGQLHER